MIPQIHNPNILPFFLYFLQHSLVYVYTVHTMLLVFNFIAKQQNAYRFRSKLSIFIKNQFYSTESALELLLYAYVYVT